MQNIDRYFAISYTRAKKALIFEFLQMFLFYTEVSGEVEGNTRSCNWAMKFPEILHKAVAQAQNCIYNLRTASLYSTT